MKAVLCPVCNGNGQVIPDWDCWDHRTMVSCYGCYGKGWVEVSDPYTDVYYPVTYLTPTHLSIPEWL